MLAIIVILIAILIRQHGMPERYEWHGYGWSGDKQRRQWQVVIVQMLANGVRSKRKSFVHRVVRFWLAARRKILYSLSPALDDYWDKHWQVEGARLRRMSSVHRMAISGRTKIVYKCLLLRILFVAYGM